MFHDGRVAKARPEKSVLMAHRSMPFEKRLPGKEMRKATAIHSPSTMMEYFERSLK